MNELISVIIPIYNVEKYICRCLDSVINQTYNNLEIILVDDGSTDNCSEICNKYKKRDDRIKVIHKKNGGLSDARNVGIENSNGEYLIFIDSDDYVNENMINNLYVEIKKENASMVLCNFEYVDENGNEIYEMNTEVPIKNECISKSEYYKKMFEKKYWYYIVVWNKIYKKSLFSDIRFPKGKINEDDFIIHKIVNKCDKIVSISESLYFYVQREGSIMNKSKDIKKLDIVEAYLERTNFLLKEGYYNEAIWTFKSALIRWQEIYNTILHDEYFRIRNNEIFEIYKNSYNILNDLKIIKDIKIKFKANCINTCPNIYFFVTKFLK